MKKSPIAIGAHAVAEHLVVYSVVCVTVEVVVLCRRFLRPVIHVCVCVYVCSVCVCVCVYVCVCVCVCVCTYID